MQGKARHATGIVGLAAASVLSTATIGRASVLAYDSFSGDTAGASLSSASASEGTTGSDPFSGGWSTNSTDFTTPAVAMNSPGSPEPTTSIVAKAPANTGYEYANRYLSNAVSSASGTTLFVSVLMQGSDISDTTADDLFLVTSTVGSSNYVFMMGVGYNSGVNEWGFQARTPGSTVTGSAATFVPVPGATITPNSPTLLVAELQYNDGITDSITMWVNPTSTDPASAAESVTFTGTATNSLTLGSVGGVQLYENHDSGSVEFGNVTLGTTFADVVPEPTSVAILALSAGAMCMRRRRRTGLKLA